MADQQNLTFDKTQTPCMFDTSTVDLGGKKKTKEINQINNIFCLSI